MSFLPPYPAQVSDVGGQTLMMRVPFAGYWGTAGIDGLNIDSSIVGEPGVAGAFALPDLLKARC